MRIFLVQNNHLAPPQLQRILLQELIIALGAAQVIQ
jgi:hypothetical protein